MDADHADGAAANILSATLLYHDDHYDEFYDLVMVIVVDETSTENFGGGTISMVGIHQQMVCMVPVN